MHEISAKVAIEEATHIFERAGLEAEPAHIIAKSLIYAELRGTASHGLIRVPIYEERIRKGGIRAGYKTSVTHEAGGLVVLDGDDGPGAAIGVEGALLAVQRAREHGIGMVVVTSANHFGATAFFTELMADQGVIGIAACNTDSAMCAPGGGSAVLGTNPLAISVPTSSSVRPTLDMATTEVALGKVLIAADRREQIPLGWAVDQEGDPTTDPAHALEGALLPAAGPKGWGLAFMIDAILGSFGSLISPVVSPLYGPPSEPQGLGMMFIAISPPTADLAEVAVDALRGEISASSMVGKPEPLAPGEVEHNRALRSDGVISVPDSLMEELAALGARLPSGAA